MNTMLGIIALSLIGTYLTIDSIPNRDKKERKQLLFYFFNSHFLHII